MLSSRIVRPCHRHLVKVKALVDIRPRALSSAARTFCRPTSSSRTAIHATAAAAAVVAASFALAPDSAHPSMLASTARCEAECEAAAGSSTSHVVNGSHGTYRVDHSRVLGAGTYGVVRLGVQIETGRTVAIKEVPKGGWSSTISRKVFEREKSALSSVAAAGGTRHVVELLDAFETPQARCLVMEFLEQGELFDHLIQYGPYTEQDAAQLLHEIALALEFLHSRGLVHLDLKPENVMLAGTLGADGVPIPLQQAQSRTHHMGGGGSGLALKLVDFGCCVSSKTKPKETRLVRHQSSGGRFACTEATGSSSLGTKPDTFGTTAYWAPELLDTSDLADTWGVGRDERGADAVAAQKVSTAVDMWALGMILAIMLLGFHPFDPYGDATDSQMEATIAAFDGDLDAHFASIGEADSWARCSKSARDLLRRLTAPSPLRRFSASQVLLHPWVRGVTAPPAMLQESHTRLRSYKEGRLRLARNLLGLMLGAAGPGKHVEPPQHDAGDGGGGTGTDAVQGSADLLYRAFRTLDPNGAGRITSLSVHKVLSRSSPPGQAQGVTAAETQELVRAIAEEERERNKSGSSDAAQQGGTSSAVDEDEEPSLEYADLQAVLNDLKHTRFAPGDIIFEQGDRADCMYFVTKGSVRVSTVSEGETVTLTELRSGDFFGESALLTGNTRNATVSCPEDGEGAEMIVVGRDEFETMLHDGSVGAAQLESSLRHASVLRNMHRTKHAIHTMHSGCEDVEYHGGSTVFRRGDDGDSMYVIREGVVAVVKPVEALKKLEDDNGTAVDGKVYRRQSLDSVAHTGLETVRLDRCAGDGEAVAAVLGPGDVFGETALIERQPRNATIVCAAPRCTLSRLDAQRFNRLVRHMTKKSYVGVGDVPAS